MNVTVDGGKPITLDEFFRTNDMVQDEDEARIIRDLLERGHPYHGGGGAAAEFTIKPVPALLDQAVKTDDLDDAIRPIQDALGITDGGVAGAVFSGPENDNEAWAAADHAARSDMLAEWLAAECSYAMEG